MHHPPEDSSKNILEYYKGLLPRGYTIKETVYFYVFLMVTNKGKHYRMEISQRNMSRERVDKVPRIILECSMLKCIYNLQSLLELAKLVDTDFRQINLKKPGAYQPG